MPAIETIMQGFGVRTDQGSLGFCAVTLIRGTKNILVDSAQVGRRELLVGKLKEHGVTPDDIDIVVLTHSHWDHILNIDLFPNSRVLIHPLEREYAKAPKDTDWATPKYTSLILESMKLEEVKEGDEIDEGVTVLDVPGHTKGSIALLVRTDEGTAAVTGDALHSSWSALTGQPRLIFWDVEQGRQSIRKVLDRSDTYYPGHDRPFRLENGHVQYLQPTSFMVSGWPDLGIGEGNAGIGFVPGAPAATQIIE
jgi:N-acyl homoserine lactone hydrolase